MTTITLDPRQYKLQKASIDDATFRALLDQFYPAMRRIGVELSRIDSLPVMEEPLGSGNLVTTGNFSVRVPGLEGFLITGSGVDKQRLDPGGVLYVEKVDHDAGTYFVSGTARPSRETLIHDQIYRARPDVKVILHTHDGRALEYLRTRKTNRPIFFANLGEARDVVVALDNDDYVQLPQHGQFVVGRNVDETLGEARRHHRKASVRRIGSIVRNTVAPLAAAAGLVLVVSGIAAQAYRFRDCDARDNMDGTVTYSCPAEIDCGPIKSWEGESSVVRADGINECTYWVGGTT